MAKLKSARGGFECEFVENPPKFFQTECPICLQILRNPYQVVCCGKSYCQPCIEQVKNENNPCPHCNEKNFTDFPNKGLQQSLYQCPVYCSNKEEGCKWSGELGELDKHLNLEPPAERQLEGCDFALVQCIHCKEPLQRQLIEMHQNEQCQNRPFSCEFCQVYKSTYDDIMNNHKSSCDCAPIECTNGCGQLPQRNNLDAHITRDCPLTVIDCDFHYAGCDVKLPRKDMPEHLTTAMVTHMSMLAITNKTLVARVEELETKNSRLETENESLRNECQLLLATQSQDYQSIRDNVAVIQKELHPLPVDITMPDFAQHKQINDVWYSPPIYTHFQGYKLCMRVYVNSSFWVVRRVVSVHLHTMRGEFDETLKWPFCGDITIQLLAQQEQSPSKENYSKTIKIEGDRVKTGDRAESGSGVNDYVGLTTINGYVHDDSVTFRILKFTQRN